MSFRKKGLEGLISDARVGRAIPGRQATGQGFPILYPQHQEKQ